MKSMTPNNERPILEVKNLQIAFGPLTAVDQISFSLDKGEVLAIVGESGSGKSLTALAIMGLLPPAARIAAGSVRLLGQELVEAPETTLRKIRGGTVAMIFQDPMMALNPVRRIGNQIAEIVAIHQPALPRAARRNRVADLLALVGVPDPRTRAAQYPHEFSGGMRQRAMIAMAIANDPALLIADEPTTALDVTIQAQVMRVLQDVRQRTGAAMILITHDLGLVAESADRVAVMYGGRLMEQAAVSRLFARPAHPYTTGLLASLPRLDGNEATLRAIPGAPPSLAGRPAGCVFSPRCLRRQGRATCTESSPALAPVEPAHHAACFFAEEPDPPTPPPIATAPTPAPGDPILHVENLSRHFRQGGILRRRPPIRAVDGIDFTLRRGETLGIVGESGCGKSTLGRTILGLHAPTAGRVLLDGKDTARLSPRQRRAMQVVFQDPFSSLDPRMSAAEIVAEPLRIHGIHSPARVAALLEAVGLRPEMGARRPASFSGGQRQRIGIARALALDPAVLILDEPVSALDVSVQAQVINLLQALQRDRGLTYVFIAHDLSVVRHISHRVAVMVLGRIVETGTSDDVFARPLHPYTVALLSAAPHPDPNTAATRRRIVLEGDLPNPADPPSDCTFRTRCFMARPICAAQPPPLAQHAPNHSAACHFPGQAHEHLPIPQPAEAMTQ